MAQHTDEVIQNELDSTDPTTLDDERNNEMADKTTNGGTETSGIFTECPRCNGLATRMELFLFDNMCFNCYHETDGVTLEEKE